MKTSLKESSSKFNMLHLDYSEFLFNSIKAYGYKIISGSKNIEAGNLHINSHSIVFDSDDISIPIVKLKFDENYQIKSYKFDDMVKFYNTHLEPNTKDNNILAFSHREREKEKDKEKNMNYNSSSSKRGSMKYGSKDKELGSILLNSVLNNFNNNTSNIGNGLGYSANTNTNTNTYNKKSKSLLTHNNNIIKENNAVKSFSNKDLSNNLNNTNLEIGCSPNKIILQISEFEIILKNVLNPLLNHNHIYNLNHNLSIIDNSQLQLSHPNKTKKQNNKLESLFIHSNFVDLYNYFSENNLNICSFMEIFANVDKTFNQGDKQNKNSYAVLVMKTKEFKKINREFIDKYEDVNLSRSYLVIMEGKAEEIDKFLFDVFVFTEALGNHDELSLVNMVTSKKLEEVKEIFEVVDTKKIKNENLVDHKLEHKDSISNKKKIMFQCPATRILPEKYQNGLFVIHYNESSNKSVSTLCEFIPINNNLKRNSLKFSLNEIKALIKFRFLYQYKALNILFHTKKRSKVFDFENEENFKIVLDYLKENCFKLDKTFTDIKYHTNMWVDGLMSNFDYLMYLNIMGGRSFDDLGQYPIMPWVLTNYEDEDLDLNDIKNFRDLSKPIGALNLKRLKSVKDNYKELKDQGKEFPYLYGTYYSFPYIVFYYLIRSHPFYFLRFQGGNFGPTDRLFFSIKESWNNSYKNPGSQDVKELIPEFYNSDGEFLKNFSSLNFGKTQNDQIVDDVILPKWAKSEKDFVNIMRSALESEIVSSNLHQWIDLVFGYKQRGEKALEADNLFHHLRYDDKFYLVLEKPDEERQGEIDNIFEFGQTPIQLFLTDPHPKKRSKISINELLIKSESSIKVFKLKKERINIEKKYEKERRQRESEIEDIQKKLEEKQKDFKDQIKLFDEIFVNKEFEFAAYLSVLMQQNLKLKENFNNYDENKNKVYQQWIQSLKIKHEKEIESVFDDRINLYKYIKEIEHVFNNYKSKDLELLKKSHRIIEALELNNKEEKKLKEKFYSLQRTIRNLPYDQQVYLNKCNIIAPENDNLNIKKLIKELK